MENVNTAAVFEIDLRSLLNFCVTKGYVLKKDSFTRLDHPTELGKLQDKALDGDTLFLETSPGYPKLPLEGIVIQYSKKQNQWYSKVNIPEMESGLYSAVLKTYRPCDKIKLEFIDEDDRYYLTDVDGVYYRYFNTNVYKDGETGLYTTFDQLTYLPKNTFIDFISRFKIGVELRKETGVLSILKLLQIVGVYNDEDSFNFLAKKITELNATGLFDGVTKVDEYGHKSKYYNIDICPNTQISMVRDNVIIVYNTKDKISYRLFNANVA